MKYLRKIQKGFTLVELVVSVAIFAFMTAFLLAKYGNFDQSVLLTNLAYDVALSIRTAQSYGLNVKSALRTSNEFNFPFGVNFVKNSQSFIFFSDNNPINGIYDPGDSGDTVLSTSQIKRGAKISDLCVGSSPGSCSNTGVTKVDITFKRPDPNAIIKINGDNSEKYIYTEITFSSSDGSKRKVSVYSTGQIAIPKN